MFKRARKEGVKLRLAMIGVPGGGKTYSSLVIANQIAPGKIGLIDTENGSANLYSYDKELKQGFEFDIARIEPPYSMEKYLAAIEASEEAGHEILIIDSISHAWAGEGGILDLKTKADLHDPRANSFTTWGKFGPIHEKLKNAILHNKIHLICTMRAKQEYVLQTNDKGKQVPKKAGMGPVQREGMEYEFDTVFDIESSHYATSSKDRTGLFPSDEPFKIDDKVGKKILNWLNSVPEEAPKPSTKQLRTLYATAEKAHWEKDEVIAYMEATFNKKSSSELTLLEYQTMSKFVEAHPVVSKKPAAPATNDFTPAPLPFERGLQ